MKRVVLVLLCLYVSACWGQLTPSQKLADFQNLASLYIKQYAPAQWKLQVFNYNLDDVSPWIARVQQTTDDVGFYEVMSEYVASLNDAHSIYFNPSDFSADLKFSCDLYDGKVLIDFIDRKALPASKFDFQIGDELVMVDGKTPDDYIQDFSRFFSDANPTSTKRDAVGFIPFRFQGIDPRAEELGATATVVIRRQAGNLQTYVLPWVKTGTPLSKIGPSPSPQKAGKNGGVAAPKRAPGTPDYMKPLHYLHNVHLPSRKTVLNFDALPPVFQLPKGFVKRLGNEADGDPFFTGTFQAGGKTIGYIRIPDFAPFDPFFGELMFDQEITYMEQSTQGLVVDVMRNPGGDACYAEDLMSRLMTQPFHDFSVELRPGIFDVQSFEQAVQDAIAQAAPTYVIQILQQDTRIVKRAYQQGGLTTPIPLCSIGTKRAPNKDETTGKLLIYDKPILLLTDEFSASGADLFAAMFQDAQRGKNFGMRTMGAGGTVSDNNPAGYYSEGLANVTTSLIIRKNPIVSADYPTAPLIENIGVRPDIQNDYMTKSNLLKQGADFVTAFTNEILTLIGK